MQASPLTRADVKNNSTENLCLLFLTQFGREILQGRAC